MAVNNFERLAASPVFKDKLPSLLADDARRFEDLLQLISTSQFLADTFIQDPDSLEALIAPVGRNPSTAELTARLKALVDASSDDAAVLQAFRRFRRREMLRIGVNDVLRDRPLEEITRDLCRVADASLEIAVRHSVAKLAITFGMPNARLTVLAFGKLGGDELNYSSDLDLLFVYDRDGETRGPRATISHTDFFGRVVAEVLRLLSSHTDRGFAYRIDLRLRPEGAQGPLARSLAATLSYYDVMGRTWERQALIKLRHVAGDPDLGNEFLDAIKPFVYRKYFSFSEINEVKALKRQMEARAARSGDDRDVKTGRGGIRDIEYTVQFLQLANGGDLPAVRQRNTLLALEALEIAGCLTGNETYILADAYRFLRKTEHRLQLLFDLQTHSLPAGEDELRKLSKRMGFPHPPLAPPTERLLSTDSLAPQRRSRLDEAPSLEAKSLLIDPLDQFLQELHEKTNLDRSILDHLLHQSFAGEASKAEPESDLILHPQPDDLTIREVLSKYRFHNMNRAYEHLSRLARESVGFLSHRRCRHFLASIAPQLLRAVSETPDPDEALANLDTVTASLGAKAVLYEAFTVNPPSLKLYVDLCSGSPFLSTLLTTNPGMIDELLDTLVLDQPRSREDLQMELAELLHGATDPEPILHSFQDKELLRIGVRDLLGKSPVRATTAALSDLAETLLIAVVRMHVQVIQTRFAVIALGKLGGRELNYHSDLDLLVVCEDDAAAPFFTEIVQQTIRTLTQSGPLGRLYAVDMRLRPFGKSGSLVVPLSEFRRYFAEDAHTWERQALGRARVVHGDAEFAAVVDATLREAMVAKPWQAECVAEIRLMRDRLQQAAGPGDLKRSAGGLVDIEFLVQLLQLKYGREVPAILTPNVLDALAEFKAAKLLAPGEAATLESRYTFLRAVETRLRIVSNRSLSEIPHAPEDREKLARRLGFEAKDDVTAGERFQIHYQRLTADVRTLFDTITLRES